MKHTKVLVAMSGGVDSSVAAMLMKKNGYEVVGAFMKNWSNTKNQLSGECQWREDRRMAMKIAAKIGIPLITFDFERQYRKEVISKMFRLYKKGITPNPDIDCNQKIKFPLLWKEAKKLGADFIVTGHYARIKKIKASKNSKKNVNDKNKFHGTSLHINFNINERASETGECCQYELFRAKDETKDQSYFLYTLNQNDLSHSLFPVGNYTKKQVRKIAEKNGFENFNRKGTVGICFVGKINLKKFLQKKIKPKQGKILNPEGKQIGVHDGIYYYTIGQRIGSRFGIEIEKKDENGGMKRWYVARKIKKTNTIIAAPENHPLNFRKEMIISKPHWINEMPKKNNKVLSRIRQVGELLPSTLKYDNNKKKHKLILKKKITGVSEGQAVVLYSGKKVLGGGVIGFE
jgi:tRNA-specific 2-thiouridylase